MRKKYLSALLFGALLFASAGTFTSCKDYDDDINNLQEQIDVIVADLNDLKTLVGDGGVSSVTFDEATGVLTVVDAAGTHTYTIKTPADEVGEIKVTIDDERNLVVNDEVIGKVGDVVTVNEEGYLCVNGEATEIKAGKYAILENESDNTYTITLPDAEGNMQTITLLKSVATNIAIEAIATAGTSYSIFSEINATGSSNATQFQENNGIAWGVAPSDIDWDGPKGAVKAGQLLVGQQNTVQVNVTPQNVELDKQALALVDYDGNVAPVAIVATTDSNNPGNTGSRAVAKGGLWNLNITMNSTVTASTIGTDFAQKDGTINQGNHDDWKNKLYALRVNGNVITPYTFVIDTDVAACAMSGDDKLTKTNGIIKVDDEKLTRGTALRVSLGSHELSFEQASVYDYKFEIVDADKNDAEAWGITLENNVLTAPNNATAAGKTIHLNVVLLGVNGREYSYKYTDETSPIAITFKAASSSAITLPVSTYKVTPEEYAKSIYNNTATDKKYATITLDMGDLFSGLTAQEAIAIQESATSTNPGKFSLTTKDETFVFLRNTIVSSYNQVGEGKTICFYEADGKTPVAFDDTKADIRRIKYAKVIYNMSNNPKGLWNPKATLGEHILTMVLEDAAGNQIRKANIPVNVTIPTFFELFTKSGAWTDDTALAVVDEKGNVDLKTLYTNKTKVADAAFNATASWFIADNKSAGAISTTTPLNILELNKEAVTSSHTLKDLASGLVYDIVPVCPNFTVNSGDFTMDVISKLNAAKFVYYGEDGQETNIVVRPTVENTIAAYTAATTDKPKTGLSFYKAGIDNVFTGETVVNGFKLNVSDNLVNMTFDDKAGTGAKAEFSYGNLTVSGLATGSYTTVLTVTFKVSTLDDDTVVYETFEIPLTVQAE